MPSLKRQPCPTRLCSFLLLPCLIAVTNGNERSANHLLLFDSLPAGISPQSSVPFDVRTNFSGSVQLVESRDFRVVVNITAPSLQQAYDVSADLFRLNGGVVLQIREIASNGSVINVTWLAIGIAVATVLVGIITLIHALQWYKQECRKYDFPDQKSYASSSQRGIYRSRNSIQMVNLPPSVDGSSFRGEGDGEVGRNLRCEEELRQVREMPEEEEAEALEMEQLHKKLKEDTGAVVETEDSDPQELNLIKSKFHSQAKTVHKDLIRKPTGTAAPGVKKLVPAYKHTQNGTYKGVPTEMDEEEGEASDDEMDDVLAEKEKMLNDDIENLQVNLDNHQEKGLITFGKSSTDKLAKNGQLSDDPMVMVLADVHKTTCGQEPGASRKGNYYAAPSELRAGGLSSFVGDRSRSGPTPPSLPASQLTETNPVQSTSDPTYEDLDKKYQLDGPWFAQTFASMSDIPEDPREDQSEVSGSARSTSMYGSSEIFDAADVAGGANTYYNLDSDIEVPPLDSEDVFSDGGLPSPLGFLPMGKSLVADKGKVNDDIKLIPGALKSPGPNTNRLVGVAKPRPYSSIILRTDNSPKPVSIPGLSNPSSSAAESSDASPPLPPPPAEQQPKEQPETVFEFPPPPKFYQPPKHLQNRNRVEKEKSEEVRGNGEPGGDYVQIKKAVENTRIKEGGTPAQRGRRGGRGVSALNSTYMNLTVVCTICVLSLVSGALSGMRDNETRVDITVFAPKHFFTNRTRVFFNMERDTEAFNTDSVLVYDVPSPLLSVSEKTWRPQYTCNNHTCEQGCDEHTGSCMCYKGYRLDYRHKCIDVNECMEAKFRCDAASGCYNRKGTYECVCGEGYYSFKRTCRECSEPCPDGHYEVQPCVKHKDQKKICEACTSSCPNGYYMEEPCTATTNAICRECQPMCGPGEYELRQCTNFHDRQCRRLDRSTSTNAVGFNNFQECNEPCPRGTYELQPCTRTQHKICQACTLVCPDGYYMFKPCSAKSDAVCREFENTRSSDPQILDIFQDCTKSCPSDYFEIQPCNNFNERKICKACMSSCPSGYFMKKACSERQDTDCRACRPQCPQGQFESKSCSNDHDRECKDCSEPCPANHYQVQDCSRRRPKICKECMSRCPSGSFMYEPCSTYADAKCRDCKPRCGPGQYEARPCTNYQDRLCLDHVRLAAPESSSNLIVEDRSRVIEDSTVLDKLPAHYVGFPRYNLRRGTGLYFDITVYFINAAQQFMPVNISQPFNLDLVAPSVLTSYNVQRYCPSPIPDYYVLRYREHQSLTYKQHENGSIEACETHKMFGDFLPSDSSQASSGSPSFLCSQPGTLSESFKVDEDFFMARTKWVDKSKRCQRYSRACESCTLKCGTNMMTSNGYCSLATDDDTEHSESPKLMTCYNCCVKKECADDCKDYHKRRCQPEQCSKGNLLEFTLDPSWGSSQQGRFFCHIAPVKGQHLLELEYEVRHDNWDRALHKAKVNLDGGRQWEKEGKLDFTDGLISLSLDSSLGTVPDFLEGGTSAETSTFKVGTYKTGDSGARLKDSPKKTDQRFLRPTTVDGVPQMPQSHTECSNPNLLDMNLASNMDNPYLREPDVEAHATNFSAPFTVTKFTKEPVVKAFVPQEDSLLSKMFSPVLLDADHFSVELTQNASHWVVDVKAQVQDCPGYLHIEVKDAIYSSHALFDCDVAVMCPENFTMTFTLPTADRLGIYKDILIEVKDKEKMYHFRVFRRATFEEEMVGQEDKSEVFPELDQLPPAGSVREDTSSDLQAPPSVTPDLPLPFPYLLAVSGLILLLLVLAILGFCFQPGLPETLYAEWYHPLFAMGYMMVQFAYSIIVSGTMFFLILTLLTSKHVDFVLNHQSGLVSTASNHIELLQLQRHLEAEISRLDAQSDVAQEGCIKDVQLVVADMKKLHDSLLSATSDIFQQHRLELLLEQQKLHVRYRLEKDLDNFRLEYSKAARAVLRRINQDALASFQNVEHNNTWLEGARFLHKAVMLLREVNDKEVKNFMDWTEIKAQLSKLEIDLQFSLPALPRLEDIPVPPPEQPSIERQVEGISPDTKDPIRSIQMHNNWFFPLDDSTTGAGAMFQAVGRGTTVERKRETGHVFYVFLALFIWIDLILLAHRMCKAWTTARLILFGFPEYFRERKEEDGEGNEDVFSSKESNKSRLAAQQGCKDSPNFMAVKMFISQTISTTFFPKIVFALAACVISVCLLQLSNHYLTVDQLGKIGLYHSADEYVDLQTMMTNGRIDTHAAYINTVDFPAFQSTMSGYISRHRAVLALYKQHLTGLQSLSAEMYCQHLKVIGLAGNCSEEFIRNTGSDETEWDKIDTISYACRFQPVVPRHFTREGDNKAPVSEVQVEALLESLRFIIYYTTHLVVIYLSVVVLKELASAVIWILTQRSGIVRLRIIVEQDQDDSIQ